MTNTNKKQTSYEVITNKIIEKMQKGIIPWVKPWHADAWKCNGKSLMFPCFSHSNGKRYNMMNHMLLDFQAGEYATFQQIKAEGGKVKKGEKGQIITGWIIETHTREDENGEPILNDDGKPSTYTTYALRYYTVFNILTQVDGIQPKHNWTKDEAPDNGHDAIDAAEKIIAGYINSADAPKFKTVKGSDEAYYSPAEDLVVVPDKSQFDLIEGYYGTTFHELTHSTLKESRCNRREQTKKAAFGSKEYSKEELVAEMGSAFLSNQAGLDTSKTLDNSVAYLQSWIKVLKNDPKMIVQASAAAEKAAEYILNAQGTTEDDADKTASKAEKVNKKADKTNVKKAFEYVAKNGTKNHCPFKSGKYEDTAYATDGHQIIKTTEEVDTDTLDKIDADKCEKIFETQADKTATLNITAKEVREGIKTAKNGKRNAKVIYTTPEGISLNANYLLNALTATGATEYSYTDAKHPVIFKNDTTVYLLCTINTNPRNGKVVTPEGFKVIG